MEFEIEQRVEHKVSGKRGEIADYGKTRAPTYVVRWDDGSTTTVAGPVVRSLPMVAEKAPLNPPKGEQSKFFRQREEALAFSREIKARASQAFDPALENTVPVRPRVDFRPKNLQRVIVTAAEIEAAKTRRGGWTKRQLTAWGVPWPPRKGWKKRLISGTTLPVARQEEFKFVRDPNYTMTLRDWWRKPEKMNREQVKMDPKVVMGPEMLDPWRRAR